MRTVRSLHLYSGARQASSQRQWPIASRGLSGSGSCHARAAPSEACGAAKQDQGSIPASQAQGMCMLPICHRESLFSVHIRAPTMISGSSLASKGGGNGPRVPPAASLGQGWVGLWQRTLSRDMAIADMSLVMEMTTSAQVGHCRSMQTMPKKKKPRRNSELATLRRDHQQCGQCR